MKKTLMIFMLTLMALSVLGQGSNTTYKFSGGLGYGLGIYGGQTNDKNETNDTSKVDAVCGIAKLHFDYTPINTLGLGFSFERNGFFTGNDTSGNAKSYNVGLSIKFKFINREFNSLYLDVLPAYSFFTIENDADKNNINKWSSNGFNFQAGLGWDHYFGEHFGMYLGTYYTLYKYNLIYDQDGYKIGVNSPVENLTLKLSGMNFVKLGLQYRF
jgi:hypothetical protein